MADHRDEAAIRARAYQLWEESGYADGSQDAHWRQAEREIAGRGPAGEQAVPDAAPSLRRPNRDTGRHTDGMSTFPSVLDPKPEG